MASSVSQLACVCSSIQTSIEVVHSTTNRNRISRRNCTSIKAVKDSSSSSSSSEAQKPENFRELALTKARAYKEAIKSNPTPKISQLEHPAFETSESSNVGEKNGGSLPRITTEGAKGYNGGPEEEKREISTNELVKKKSNEGKQPTISVSAIDFVGLGFSDKRQNRGLPPGLVPISDPFPEGNLPEVEIIIGDKSKFGDETSSKLKTSLEEDSGLYKPKVSTWGVFPRPGNISKTYGGGKVIRPGEGLETAESKAAKEAHTRQLIAAYKRQIGLNIDPKLRIECEKALEDGDSFMDRGSLREALPFYEKVMDKLVFQSELHGLAALQWSICQDSLNRSNEARVMYEKLQSHPNVRVSKRARQFIFSFQAMEMMKVTSSSLTRSEAGYQNFFEAFIENKSNYLSKDSQVDDDAVTQALPYVLFLVSPILIILVIAVQKNLA